jgi:hypothetical protein
MWKSAFVGSRLEIYGPPTRGCELVSATRRTQSMIGSPSLSSALSISLRRIMNHHHCRRAIGVKDKNHENQYPTSLYDGNTKKHRSDGVLATTTTTTTRSGRGSYFGSDATLWQRLSVAPLLTLLHDLLSGTVSSDFQPRPSLLTRQVSWNTLQLLRMNAVISASLPQAAARQATALESASPGAATRVVVAQSTPQSIPNYTTLLASSNQWLSMAAPRVDASPSMLPHMFAMYSPCTMPQTTLAEQMQMPYQSHCANGNTGSGFIGLPTTNSPDSVSASSGTGSCKLPMVLSCCTDELLLTKFQVFLRMHIEVFAATHQEISSRIRGRHKQLQLNQVGVRCRHCAHIPTSQRLKGAVYFPLSTMGIYQASQNMCSTHLQCGLCPEMPESIKTEFALLIGTKTAGSSSSGGRAYWGRCAQQMGLVDTEQGVFPAGAIP